MWHAWLAQVLTCRCRTSKMSSGRSVLVAAGMRRSAASPMSLTYLRALVEIFSTKSVCPSWLCRPTPVSWERVQLLKALNAFPLRRFPKFDSPAEDLPGRWPAPPADGLLYLAAPKEGFKPLYVWNKGSSCLWLTKTSMYLAFPSSSVKFCRKLCRSSA